MVFKVLAVVSTQLRPASIVTDLHSPVCTVIRIKASHRFRKDARLAITLVDVTEICFVQKRAENGDSKS